MKSILAIRASDAILATRGGSMASERWALSAAESAVASTEVVISGDTDTPEAWVREAASKASKTIVEFRVDGARWTSGQKTPEFWYDRTSPTLREEAARWIRFRDEKILEALLKSKDAGWNTKLLGLHVPWCTNGHVQAMHALALNRGIESELRVYSEETGRPDIVWIDTETTGSDTNRHALIEVAAIRTDASCRKQLGTFEEKIEVPPWAQIDYRAIEINRYNELFWRGAKKLDVVMQMLSEFLPQRFLLAGYNVSFDRRFILDGMNRCKLPEPGWIKQRIDGVEKVKELDVLFVARKSLKKRNVVPDCKLTTICDYFGISNVGAHGAMADVERTISAYRKILTEGAA